MSNLQRYTFERALKELVQVENHLEDALVKDPAFCVACLKDKHLLALSGYAEEGVKFFPEDSSTWMDLQKYADDARQRLLNTQEIDFRSEIDRAREKRKALIEKYDQDSGWECDVGVCKRAGDSGQGQGKAQEDEISWPCEGGNCGRG